MHSEERISVQQLTRLALLLALTSPCSPAAAHPGDRPLVNLMLILSTAVIGTAGGVSIGLLTPWAALLLGIIPLRLPRRSLHHARERPLLFSYGSLAGKARAAPGSIALGSALKFVVIAGAARHF